VAETSGFMTDLPQSSYLSLSMKRAISAAQQRSHRYVTLEHLLLALLDDPSATEILEALGADIPTIRRSIGETVNRNLATLYTPGEFDLHASYKVERVLQSASDDADRLGCEEVDAAFVLAALSRETDNPAGQLLKENGFAYTNAVTWIYANRGTSPAMRAARLQSRLAAAAPEPQSGGDEPAAPAAAPSSAQAASGQATAQRSSLATEGATALAQQDPDAQPDYETQPAEASRNAPEPEPSPAMQDPLELGLELAEDEEPLPPPPQWLRPKPAKNGTQSDAPQKPGSGQPQTQGRAAPSPPDRQQRQERPRQGWADAQSRSSAGMSEARPQQRGQGVQERDEDAGAGQRRSEPQVPTRGRLDEMRVRGSGGNNTNAKARAPLPAPVPASGQPQAQKKRARQRSVVPAEQARSAPPAVERQRGARPSRRKQNPQESLVGRLVENIPRRMRAEVGERIEVRISREDTKLLASGMDGRGAPMRHDLMITQTMSVALRAPDGGFTIEPLSPETQWIFDRPDNADLYGRWRWVVTPHHSGERRLQLIVAGRSIGQNGLVGDSALPDQVITVRVRTNYLRVLGRGMQWLAAMIVGGILTELALVGMNIFG